MLGIGVTYPFEFIFLMAWLMASRSFFMIFCYALIIVHHFEVIIFDNLTNLRGIVALVIRE